MKNKVRGQAPNALFFIEHEQGNALNDLWKFLAV